MFLTNGCPCPSLAKRVGRSKEKLKIEKLKNWKSYVQFEK